MKFVLVSSIIFTLCLAGDMLSSDIDSLRDMIMDKFPPDMLPPLYVTFNGWDRDVAMAFALGLTLGEQCVAASSNSTSSNSSSHQKKWEMITWSYTWQELESGSRGKVVIKNLSRLMSAVLEWNHNDQAYNPLSELFDVQGLRNPENYEDNDEMDLEDVRLLLAKYTKKSIAMITIDIAILKWLVSAIKAKPDRYHMVEIDESLFMPLCALSMSSLMSEHFTEDILVVLSEVQNLADPAFYFPTDVRHYTASLVTIYKVLEDGLIRTKVEEILTMMCPNRIQTLFNIRMLLWNDHPFVKLMEAFFPADQLSSYEASLQRQADWNRKVYSIGHTYIDGTTSELIYINEFTFLSANIEEDGILKWEATTPILGDEILFGNEPGLYPKQVRLFVISQIPVPLWFWQAVTSCRSLLKFQKLLTEPVIRYMILTYGITILESSSSYVLTSAHT